jgi:hypothetical protein
VEIYVVCKNKQTDESTKKKVRLEMQKNNENFSQLETRKAGHCKDDRKGCCS